MDDFTNTIIAKRMELPHTSVRRWAKEFLPPDPKAGQRSGYTKTYTMSQAFDIVFGGYLVADLKLSIHDTKQILSDLCPWLREKGLKPDNPGALRGVYAMARDIEIGVYRLKNRPDFHYEVEIGLEVDSPIETMNIDGDHVQVFKKRIVFDRFGAEIKATDANFDEGVVLKLAYGMPFATIDIAGIYLLFVCKMLGLGSGSLQEAFNFAKK